MQKEIRWEKRHSFFAAMILAAITFWNCSSSYKQGKEDSGGYYVITKNEISAALEKRPMQNAFEIIEFLRPRYLRSRTQNSVSRGAIRSQAVVYMNGVRFGTVNELTNISYQQINEIRYLKSTEATQRYGMGHEGGAILISTK